MVGWKLTCTANDGSGIFYNLTVEGCGDGFELSGAIAQNKLRIT
jgi:hypothetical protein